jgi:hypothetical protein
LALDTLPFHHKDPFDRLLIAQAKIEKLILVSCDPLIAKYPVKIIPIQLMIATHPWFKTRRHVLQRGEPPQRSGS